MMMQLVDIVCESCGATLLKKKKLRAFFVLCSLHLMHRLLSIAITLAISCALVLSTPEQIHIAVTGSASQMSIVWLTAVNTTTSIVNYGTTP